MQAIHFTTLNLAVQQRLTLILTYKYAKKISYVSKKNTDKKSYNKSAQSFVHSLVAELELTVIVTLSDFTITEMYLQYLQADCNIAEAINYIL
jgi:hypothetical protein